MFLPKFRSIHNIHSVCPPPTIFNTKNATITLLDVTCSLGRNLALLLKQSPNINELRIFSRLKNDDICSLATDLNYIDTRVKVIAYKHSSIKEAIMGSNVVACIGGCQTKINDDVETIFRKNATFVRKCAIYMAEFNPNGIFCVAQPPVEALVPMVSEVYKKADSYDQRKIIGVTSPLSMIANHFMSLQACDKVDAKDIICPTTGGTCPETTVAVLSQTKPCITINPKDCSDMQYTIATAEREVLKVKSCTENNPMFYLAPALSIYRFLNCVVKALQGDEKIVECAYVRQSRHIGRFLPYMTSIVQLGRYGVTSSHMPVLGSSEIHRLKSAVPKIVRSIKLGESYVKGNIEPKRIKNAN